MIRFEKTIWCIAASAVAILCLSPTARAVPVVPNFTQETDDESHRNHVEGD